jgi:hypothetical protein
MTQTGSRMEQLSMSGSARAAGRTELPGCPLLLSMLIFFSPAQTMNSTIEVLRNQHFKTAPF